jgi:hypothetical protein
VLPGIHLLVVLLHLVLDRFEVLRPFRINMIVCAHKPHG